MEQVAKYLKIEGADFDVDGTVSANNNSTDVVVHNYDEMRVELPKATRENFMVWKDYDF